MTGYLEGGRENGRGEKWENEHEYTVFLGCYFSLIREYLSIFNLEEFNGQGNSFDFVFDGSFPFFLTFFLFWLWAPGYWLPLTVKVV